MNKIVSTVAFGALACMASAATYPYGVCAHVTRGEGEGERLGQTIRAMELANIRWARSDIDSWILNRKDGTFDFAKYDRVIGELDAHGMKLLPIFYGPRGGKPPVSEKEFEEYRNYVKTVVSRYRDKFPVVEIWNEANLNGFFRGADPIAYAKVLKVAYETVKSVDSNIRVTFTGTAGVPIAWIRKVLENGAAQSFDIMNVHPYSHPGAPEGVVDRQTKELKKLLAEFGRGDVPIWFSEIGWPTHTIKSAFSNVLLAGLKVARPEQKSWNVIVADLQTTGVVQDQAISEQLSEVLPSGSSVKVYSQEDTCRLLKDAGAAVDLVVYPYDESFPSDTIEAVNDFITRGGVLADMGGLPCYFGRRDNESVNGMQHGGALGKFPFGFRAWWLSKDGRYPAKANLFATEAGTAVGVKQEPTGFEAERFLAPDRIGKDSEWIPLIAGKTTNGVDLVGAAVVRYKGERKGAAVLCSLYGKRMIGTNNEENQARFTARGLGIAFAEGVEAYFPYNLRAREIDPFYSEDHFGLMHADFQPKPSYSAYANFIVERPAGSVQKQCAWHDEDRVFFFPQWTRPDGVKAGMVWTRMKGDKRTLRFIGGTPMFRNMYGRKIAVREVEKGVYNLAVSSSPIYFSGAELAW